jgi:hypothetical protein
MLGIFEDLRECDHYASGGVLEGRRGDAAAMARRMGPPRRTPGTPARRSFTKAPALVCDASHSDAARLGYAETRTGGAAMKKLLASSALVFGIAAGIATLTLTPQPAIADPSGGCSGCVVDQPDDGTITQDPADGGNCNGCALPAPVTPKVAPIVVADGNCSNC